LSREVKLPKLRVMGYELELYELLPAPIPLPPVPIALFTKGLEKLPKPPFSKSEVPSQSEKARAIESLKQSLRAAGIEEEKIKKVVEMYE